MCTNITGSYIIIVTNGARPLFQFGLRDEISEGDVQPHV